MNRRSFIRLIASGLAASTLDVDKLLWIPGQKTIFLPSIHRLTYSQIAALELERISGHMKSLFERDDTFYAAIKRNTPIISSRSMRIPLIIKPGEE